MEDKRQITARSVLLGFLGLRRYSPDLADWTVDRMADNPPRLYRLLQLVAMFDAFDIPWDPKSFLLGSFIEPEHPRYDALLTKLVKESANLLHDRPMNHQLPACFGILFDYRSRLDNVLSFSGGVMEASGLYLLAHHKTEELNRIIGDNIPIVEDILVAFISPEGESFSVEYLVQNYAYPDVDLFEIDLDYW